VVSILHTPRDRVLYKLAEQASANTEIAKTLDRKCTGPDFDAHVAVHTETAALFRRLHMLVAGGLLDEKESVR
jgi:hypothetical protein